MFLWMIQYNQTWVIYSRNQSDREIIRLKKNHFPLLLVPELIHGERQGQGDAIVVFKTLYTHGLSMLLINCVHKRMGLCFIINNIISDVYGATCTTGVKTPCCASNCINWPRFIMVTLKLVARNHHTTKHPFRII